VSRRSSGVDFAASTPRITLWLLASLLPLRVDLHALVRPSGRFLTVAVPFPDGSALSAPTIARLLAGVPTAYRPAWVVGPTGRGVRVAVIYGGSRGTLPASHPPSGNGRVAPADAFALGSSSDDPDRIGSGAACGQLVWEAAPAATIIPIRVSEGGLETSATQLEAGLRSALEEEAEVVNLNLASLRSGAVAPLYAAIEELRRRGSIVVASAFPPGQRGDPGAFENAIGVEAGAVPGPLTYWWRHNAEVQCVAFGAPPGREQGRSQRSGAGANSYAAARIAGIVALCCELEPRAGLELTREWLARNAAPVHAQVDRRW
jgi:hypothetical protein